MMEEAWSGRKGVAFAGTLADGTAERACYFERIW